MKADTTRSNDASAYGSSSEKPRSSRTASPRSSTFRRARASALRGWRERLDQKRQVSRPAADVENAVIRLDVRLLDELAVRRLAAHQPGEDVVQRKQPVPPGCRNVRPPSFVCSGAP